jgi:hypothetical protein
MTDHRDQLIAYLATLGALTFMFVAVLIAAASGRLTSPEALGIGTVLGGLIGALRFPSARSVTVDNPPTKPVPTDPQP